MKLPIIAAAALMTLSALPIEAGAREWTRGGGVRQEKCYKRVYREKYIPGTHRNPGYVKSWKEKVEVPCSDRYWYKDDYRKDDHRPKRHIKEDAAPNVGKVDDNSCIEGSVLGGIAGGGIGAAASRGDGRLWAIPLGIVGGAMVGCQIDGG